MFVPQQRRLLIGVFLISCVLADDGDEFSNNLFTDLAPLLALFGERATMQYMSQAMGWADNVILAMARWEQSQPSARESRAIPEVELLSSTSEEVSELWNGHEVVRVMGKGPLREFILVMPEESETGGTAKSDSFQPIKMFPLNKDNVHNNGYLHKYDLNTKERVSGNLDLEKGEDSRRDQRLREDQQPGGHVELNSAEEAPYPAVIRDFQEGIVPNLTLNLYNKGGRGELYLVALCGVMLQFDVLFYFGIASVFLKQRLPKDEILVANYAFPCVVTGTLLLVSGMLILPMWSRVDPQFPKSVPLTAGHELDWLAITLAEYPGKDSRAPDNPKSVNLRMSDGNGEIDKSSDAKVESKNGKNWCWEIPLVQSPHDCKELFTPSKHYTQYDRLTNIRRDLAALSLWLSYIDKLDKHQQLGNRGNNREPGDKSDVWLRAKGVFAKRSIRLLGSYSPALEQDLRSWMPNYNANIIKIRRVNSSIKTPGIKIKAHRVFGFETAPEVTQKTHSHPTTPTVSCQPYSHLVGEVAFEYTDGVDMTSEDGSESTEEIVEDENGSTEGLLLAAESYNPLKLLLAQHMFSMFIWSAAKRMKQPLPGKVEV
ncbi:hypothetical protein HJFPF1_00006 [Paramyrothecium foliicola]|nr:hypothetical protein HJFPF1_00006 [Paramyrothecium foliicola]